MKTYLWLDSVRERCEERPWVNQAELIVAAKSKAEVARLAGETSPARLFNLTETGNAEQIEQATSQPGTIFWRHLGHCCKEWKVRP